MLRSFSTKVHRPQGLANSQLTCNLKHISHTCKSAGLLDFLVVTLGFGLMTNVMISMEHISRGFMKPVWIWGRWILHSPKLFWGYIMQWFTDVQLFLKDHGRLRQCARQSFGQVHLLNFPCDLLCVGAFSICPWPLWTCMYAEEWYTKWYEAKSCNCSILVWFNQHPIPGSGRVQRYYDKFAGIGCARNWRKRCSKCS